jgi:hypothetical protein
MSEQGRLVGVKAAWLGDELHHPSYWADLASRDIPRPRQPRAGHD